MRVFVTGATGYIGGSVASLLVAAGHAVRGLTRDANGEVAALGLADRARALGWQPRHASVLDTIAREVSP